MYATYFFMIINLFYLTLYLRVIFSGWAIPRYKLFELVWHLKIFHPKSIYDSLTLIHISFFKLLNNCIQAFKSNLDSTGSYLRSNTSKIVGLVWLTTYPSSISIDNRQEREWEQEVLVYGYWLLAPRNWEVKRNTMTFIHSLTLLSSFLSTWLHASSFFGSAFSVP